MHVSYLNATLSHLSSFYSPLSLSPSLYYTHTHTLSLSHASSLSSRTHTISYYCTLTFSLPTSLIRRFNYRIDTSNGTLILYSWIPVLIFLLEWRPFPGDKGIEESDYLHMQRQTSAENKVLESSRAVLTCEVHPLVTSYHIICHIIS